MADYSHAAIAEESNATGGAQPKWFIGVSAAALLLGGLMIISSRRTEESAKTLPRMTCGDLIDNGPAGNRFITLTDVQICTRGNAFHRDMDAASEMYVPIYAARLKKEPPADELRLLLQVLDDRDMTRLSERPAVGELNVELWTPTGRLDPWVRDRLEAIYPGIQLAKCRILSVGLHEPSLRRAQSELFEGAFLVIVGIAFQAGWPIWRRLRLRFGKRHSSSAL